MNALIEQISTWLSSFVWPFLKEHPVGTAFMAIFTAWLTQKILRSKAKPSIADAKITVNISDFGPYNAAAVSFVAVNRGSKPCNLRSVQVLATDLTFRVVAVTDERVLEPIDLGKITGKLPMSIEAYKEKTVSFRAEHNIKGRYALPENLNLEVNFDCKTIRQEVNRVGDTDVFK